MLLDSTLGQIDLPLAARGLLRSYRIGAAARGYDAAAVVARSETFDGVGLRPYRVAHLRQGGSFGGDVALSWTRRTRIDGDSWQSLEVPLAEEAEAYLVEVRQGATLLRTVTVGSPGWTWTSAMQIADAPSPGVVHLRVAQISQRFGPGHFAVLEIAV